MSTPFIGEIRMFGFGFPPAGWAEANGQLLSIQQNLPLFQLIGTTYGGDGVNTFALPDLRGRMANHMGQGPGLSARTIGDNGGAETRVLTVEQLPNHTHPLMANSLPGTTKNPGGNVLAQVPHTYAHFPNETEMNPAAIGHTGSSQPVDFVPPFLTLNFCISLQGIFPSQT